MKQSYQIWTTKKRPLSIKFDNGLFYVRFIFLIVPPDNLCSVISGPAPDRGRCKKFCPLPPVQGEVFVVEKKVIIAYEYFAFGVTYQTKKVFLFLIVEGTGVDFSKVSRFSSPSIFFLDCIG